MGALLSRSQFADKPAVCFRDLDRVGLAAVSAAQYPNALCQHHLHGLSTLRADRRRGLDWGHGGSTTLLVTDKSQGRAMMEPACASGFRNGRSIMLTFKTITQLGAAPKERSSADLAPVQCWAHGNW